MCSRITLCSILFGGEAFPRLSVVTAGAEMSSAFLCLARMNSVMTASVFRPSVRMNIFLHTGSSRYPAIRYMSANAVLSDSENVGVSVV